MLYYWKRRSVFYWCIGVFLAIGIFFALFSPEEYESTATIIPEYELQDRVNEVIESYGLLFGLTGSIRENRTPSYLLELYPYMIGSVDFRRDLMRRSFKYGEKDSAITMYQYFTETYRPSMLHTLYAYSFGLPETILESMQSESPTGKPLRQASDDSVETGGKSEFPILNLTPREKQVVNELANRISATYQRRTGIVSISATMPSPELAAKLVQLTLETLHKKAGAYKTAKGRLYIDFLETQQAQAEEELEQDRQALIDFNNTEGQPLNKRMKLQSNYEASLDEYNALNQQLQRMKLTVQEQLPTFRILDDITMSAEKIQPKRKLIVFLSLLLGIFLAVGWITVSFLTAKTRGYFSA